MADTKQAIEDVRFLATRFKGILELASVLDGIGSLENAAAEANARLTAAQSAESKAKADLDDALAAVDAATSQADAILKDAQSKADELVQNASDTADRALASAGERVTKIIADAQGKADDVTARASASLSIINSDTAVAREALAAIDVAVGLAESMLNELNGKIAAAKAQIAQMLGQ